MDYKEFFLAVTENEGHCPYNTRSSSVDEGEDVVVTVQWRCLRTGKCCDSITCLLKTELADSAAKELVDGAAKDLETLKTKLKDLIK